MTAKFDLSYDPTKTIQGLKLLATTFDQLEGEGGQLGTQLRQLASEIEKQATVSDRAEQETKQLASAIDRVEQEAKQTQAALQSYSISTTQVGNASGKAAGQAGNLNKTIDTGKKGFNEAKESVSGFKDALVALGLAGLVPVVYQAELLVGAIAKIRGAVAAGGIATLATTVASLVAIVGSAVVIWREYNKVTVDVADKNAFLDGTILKIAQSLGLVNEEAVNLVDTLAKDDEAVAEFARKMEEATKQGIEAAKRLNQAFDDLKSGLANSRDLDRFREALSGQKDAEFVEQEIEARIQNLELRKQQGKLTLEQLAYERQLIDALETRRKEILAEQEADERNAHEENKRRIDETIAKREAAHKERVRQQEEEAKRAEEEHQRELKRLEEEAKAKEDQKRKDRADSIRGGQGPGSGVSIASPSGQASPDAPFAGGTGGFRQFIQPSASGLFNQGPSPNQPGGAPTIDPQAVSQVAAQPPGPEFSVDTLLNQITEQIDKGDLINEVFKQRAQAIEEKARDEARRGGKNQAGIDAAARKALAEERKRIQNEVNGRGNANDDPNERADRQQAISDAQNDLVQQQVQELAKRGKVNESFIDVLKEAGNAVKESLDKQEQAERDIEDLKRTFGQLAGRASRPRFGLSGSTERRARGN